jgi:hypothetical protein
VAVQTTKHASPFSADDINDATRASVALRTRLSALLQATVEARNALGHKGRLDTRSLHSLAVSDHACSAETSTVKASTRPCIYPGLFGSMVRKIRLACKACYAMGKALEAMGINVAITPFPLTSCRTAHTPPWPPWSGMASGCTPVSTSQPPGAPHGRGPVVGDAGYCSTSKRIERSSSS